MAVQDNSSYYNDSLPNQYYVVRDVVCANCKFEFKAPYPRFNRLRLAQSHENLRAEYDNTEPIFYEINFCPNCGYTRIKNKFDDVNDLKRKLYKDELGIKFSKRPNKVTINATEALERFKFAILTAKAMCLPASEVAMIFYKRSWVRRILGDENGYIIDVYRAYYWFEKALSEETTMSISIDQETITYLLAVFAKDYGDYTTSLKHCGSILTSRSASDRLKNRARDLKESLSKLKERYPNGQNLYEQALENEAELKAQRKQELEAQMKQTELDEQAMLDNEFGTGHIRHDKDSIFLS